MTDRENFISIAKRRGFEHVPVTFTMCPTLAAKYEAYTKEHPLVFRPAAEEIGGIDAVVTPPEVFRERYYRNKDFRPGTDIDMWGVAHEPGSAAAFHMTYMHHPMDDFDSPEQIEAYPFPVFRMDRLAHMKQRADEIHAKGSAVIGYMQMTIWETAWYMRGMENLFCDMMGDDPMAEILLDRVTETSLMRARAFAEAGADAIFLGDDIGMQHTIMMSETLYDEWLKPRLKRIIDEIRRINPDVVVLYHSCGHVTELIPHLIEAGIDVLNPVQPECMDFRQIHDQYGDKLSFHGTIGTQSVMPFGTPEEVRRKVFENLDIAGEHGGLFVGPTHLLEPEVPLENLLAYIKACEDYTK